MTGENKTLRRVKFSYWSLKKTKLLAALKEEVIKKVNTSGRTVKDLAEITENVKNGL